MPAQDAASSEDVVDPREAAALAGLVYVDCEEPGITRRKAGRGFAYKDAKGKAVTAPAELERIRHLAIPPAYSAVWICPKANGHIQATGRDARGRKQYRYHARFREIREATKYEHVTAFAAALPHIRATVKHDMAAGGLGRRKVLATIVSLLETTLIRVGNEDYARQNKSYGLTTLKTRHVDLDGGGLHLEFKGKSNKMWRVDVRSRRAATVVKACHDLPGQQLFQYLDENGERHGVDSGDVNAYLREITGADITAKDFRTWAGTVLAALALSAFDAIDSDAGKKKNIRDAIVSVSAKLGNTPTICRKCYVHPEIVNSYLSGDLLLEVKQDIDETLSHDLPALRPEEAAVLALLETRIVHAIRHGQPATH